MATDYGLWPPKPLDAASLGTKDWKDWLQSNNWRLHHLKESLRSSCEGPVRDTPRETALGHQSPSDFLQEEYSRINSEWISENLAGAEFEVAPRDKRVPTSSGEESHPELPTLAAELIEQVRSQTQLSHSLSRVAVIAVLRCLSRSLPGTCPWDGLLDSVLKAEECERPLVASQDGDRLQLLLRRLWHCKNDDQQRSWPTHQDEASILGLLEELYTILVDADPRVSRLVVQADEYDCVTTLALYYQMEPRASLRVWMLRVFLTLCELDLQVVSLLLHSVLPMELARDLQANSDDIERTKYTALLLTVIFSTGEKPPNNVHEYVGEAFVGFLLETVESAEAEEEVAELCLGTLLSLNLHLDMREDDHFVLRALKARQDARALTERLMLLVNREDDPARVLTHELSGVPNSVLKFLVELFSDSATAELFYLNDVAVLLDIVARQLSDLPPGDKRRPLYLSLVERVLGSTSYEGHRQTGAAKVFPGRPLSGGVGSGGEGGRAAHPGHLAPLVPPRQRCRLLGSQRLTPEQCRFRGYPVLHHCPLQPRVEGRKADGLGKMWIENGRVKKNCAGCCFVDVR
ncbi:hypothetical protein HPB47_008756 [Ixodes persulcatus]|uniref:Uncharacterized protein n=1 Tax=Ixodes persulcatus TaxID=34615 RepID=A0AC60P3Z4_IXOPE|nr:hypothetical protein HPB47_008756 [Ixodes persulcatus]